MSAEIKLCKCCHKQKPLDQFDFKKDNTLKLTCRTCLLISKSRFQARPAIAEHRNLKNLRLQIMTAVYAIDDPGVLTPILTILTRTPATLTTQSEAPPAT